MTGGARRGDEREAWRRYAGPQGTRRRVRALLRRLEAAYGPFEPRPRLAPLDELILTVLSQATSDRNSLHAFSRLKQRFPTWEAVLEARVASVEAAIRPGGLAHNKARTIRKILKALEARPEGLSLAHLEEAPLDEATEELIRLPGVGLKTAACLLMFCFERPIMPVDTHVHRLSRRLGLTSERATPDQAHTVLMAITPQELIYPFHVWLIAQGRAVCSARRPRCDRCTLGPLCPSKGAPELG